jgi:hypothetical protein
MNARSGDALRGLNRRMRMTRRPAAVGKCAAP